VSGEDDQLTPSLDIQQGQPPDQPDQQQPEKGAWFGPVMEGEYIPPGMTQQDTAHPLTLPPPEPEFPLAHKHHKHHRHHSNAVANTNEESDDMSENEQEQEHERHPHRSHHGARPLAPGEEVEKRVVNNFFAVPEATSSDANVLTMWNDVIKPALPMLVLGTVHDFPLRYGLPISFALLWPTLLRLIGKPNQPGSPQPNPIPPNNAFMPALAPQALLNPNEHMTGSNTGNSDKYNPPPPPPPIPPPLPGNYQSKGVSFRGHLLVPSRRAPVG